MIPEKCPTCQSPSPILHPAMQSEGEVELCHDAWHLRVTSENAEAKVRGTIAELNGAFRSERCGVCANGGHVWSPSP